MLQLARRRAAAVVRDCYATQTELLLPPVFLCPMLAVGGDYRAGRRRQSTIAKKGAAGPQDRPEASSSRSNVAGTSASTSLRRAYLSPSPRRRIAASPPPPRGERRPARQQADTAPVRSLHDVGFASAQLADAYHDNEPIASSSYAAREAAEHAESAARQVEDALAREGIDLSDDLSTCVQIALDTLVDPFLSSDLRGKRATLDAALDILYAEADQDVDALEIIGALLCAAFLRLGRNGPAKFIVRTIDERLKALGGSLRRERWSFALREASRGRAWDFAENVLQLMAKPESSLESETASETSLRRFQSMFAQASREMQAHEFDGNSESEEVGEQLRSLQDPLPTPQAFSALFLYQVRSGHADTLQEVIHLQGTLLPESNFVNTVCHIVHLHPRHRRQGLFFDIMNRDPTLARQVFGSIATRFAAEGRLRNLVRLFRLAHFDGTRRHGGPRMALDSTVINDVIGHMYRQTRPRAALHFFRAGVKLCSDGDLTAGFVRVCWALQEAGIFLQEEMYLKNLLRVQGSGIADSEMDIPSRWPPAFRPSRTAFSALIRACASSEDRIEAVESIRAILVTILRQDKYLNADIMRAVGAVLPRFFEHATESEVSIQLENLAESLRIADETSHTQMSDFVHIMQVHGHLDLIMARDMKKLPGAEGFDPDDENHRWVTETRLDPDSPLHSQNAAEVHLSEQELVASAAAKEMDLEQKLSPRAYGLRLRIYGVVRRDYASAQAIFQSMLRHGIQPTVQHVGVIIESLIVQDRLNDARVVRDGIFTRLGNAPIALAIMTSLIRAFARQGRWSDVHLELRVLEDLRIKPDATLYSVISAAVRLARLDLVNSSSKLSDLATTAERIGATATKEASKDSKKGRPVPTTPLRHALPVNLVTGLFQAKCRDGRLYEAQCDVADALQAGTRSDKNLRDRLKGAESLILREIEFAGYKEDELLLGVEGKLSPTSELYERFNSPMHFVWGKYDDGSLTINQRKRQAGQPKHPRELGYALHLARQNREAARGDLPWRQALHQREQEARVAMMKLIHDAFASDNLRNEVFSTAEGVDGSNLPQQ